MTCFLALLFLDLLFRIAFSDLLFWTAFSDCFFGSAFSDCFFGSAFSDCFFRSAFSLCFFELFFRICFFGLIFQLCFFTLLISQLITNELAEYQFLHSQLGLISHNWNWHLRVFKASGKYASTMALSTIDEYATQDV